jgi:membrane protein implicated in regulation of membrane protease activity
VFVSGAAVAAAGAAALSAGVPTQVVVFAIVLAVSFAALRPWFVKRMRGSRGVPSRTEQLIGKDGIVTHDIDPAVGTGRVNVGGEDWMARSRDEVMTGTRVRVVGADGIVLEVTRA